ncbi:uncharacterized protein PHALS_14561 [Plasmopara halstedii]|uniref:RxLR-like protein n=1 Tax=Plasmopara halstedii TaxID=4781 RepID=A0A0P1AU78_PLAHL|nr:uncharacterized protein PHALS_14561 [Plasmopara halstedii]CEG44912.1 hypothetical protein PHALS_14561 [Plasmopara halstedii]|eukprot:XP_024581281.1 hypothetical protein PHALS_14561 [Plasmopara halstedii]
MKLIFINLWLHSVAKLEHVGNKCDLYVGKKVIFFPVPDITGDGTKNLSTEILLIPPPNASKYSNFDTHIKRRTCPIHHLNIFHTGSH